MQVGDALLIPQPLAASLGIDLPVGTPTGNMSLNMGGGTSEAAVISWNGIVMASSARVGGNKIDEGVVYDAAADDDLQLAVGRAGEIVRGVSVSLDVNLDVDRWLVGGFDRGAGEIETDLLDRYFRPQFVAFIAGLEEEIAGEGALILTGRRQSLDLEPAVLELQIDADIAQSIGQENDLLESDGDLGVGLLQDG